VNYKSRIILTVLSLVTLIGSTYAEAESSHPLHFYAGLTGSIERMTGRRTDGLTEANGTRTIYASNIRMLDNATAVAVMGGFLWKFPPLPLWMGPEVYLGRGGNFSSIRDARVVAGANRYYATDFQRKLFYGALLRVGPHFCDHYFAYLSLGLDTGYFTTTRVLATSQSSLIKKTRSFNGLSYGFGIERQVSKVNVGFDLKLIQYRRQITDDGVPLATGPAILRFTVRPIIYSASLRVSYRF